MIEYLRPADASVEERDRVTDGMLNLLGFEVAVEAEPATVREEIGRALGLYLNAVSSRRPVVFQVAEAGTDAIEPRLDAITLRGQSVEGHRHAPPVRRAAGPD